MLNLLTKYPLSCLILPCMNLLRMFRRRLLILVIVAFAFILVSQLYFEQHNQERVSLLVSRPNNNGVTWSGNMDINETKLRVFMQRLQRPVEKSGETHSRSNATPPACKLPALDPFHETVLPHIKELGELNCGKSFSKFDNNILTVEGDGISTVKYHIIQRPPDDDFSSSLADAVVVQRHPEQPSSHEMQLKKHGYFNGTAKVNSDFIRVDISQPGKEDTVEVHMNTAPKPEVLKRRVEPAGIPVSIAMIMFDSTSAASFKRKMKKTNEYLKQRPTVFLKGETIVGDGTTAQLAAMLTGIAEEDQPEARRKMPNSKPCDNWRFIFRDFAKRGYATMYSEDSPGLGTFNYRLKGFKNPPTDHYGRNFWFEADKHIHKDHCAGSERYHVLTMRYFLSLFRTYRKNPKFAFLLFSDLTHNNHNSLEYADSDLEELLKKMENESILNSTIVFIFGDHGLRFGPMRMTLQGKLEERLPHMSVTFPKWFPKKFPELYKNFQQNGELLTTPFDIYATLQHILSYPLPPKGIKTGQSLFTPIDAQKRTCAVSGVEDHWCPCLNFEKISVTDPVITKITNFTLEHINNLLGSVSEVKRLCHELKLKEIKNALQDLPNEKLQTFEQSFKDHRCDSCGVQTGQKAMNTLSNDALYQIQFSTSPNNGFFEASIKMKNGKPAIMGEISRVDAFGHQPDCIANTYVHLIKFCYCKNYEKN